MMKTLLKRFLDGLDDDYKSIVDIINGWDTLISFDELHEKLINKQLSLRLFQSFFSPLPITANPTNTNLCGCSPLQDRPISLPANLTSLAPPKVIILLDPISVNVKVTAHKATQSNIILYFDYCRLHRIQLLLLVFHNNGNLVPNNNGNREPTLQSPKFSTTLVGFLIVEHRTMLPLTRAIFLFILLMTVLTTS